MPGKEKRDNEDLMEDLSLHILDIVENSLRADAKNVIIKIEEAMKKDILKITISDDGRGMDEEELKKAKDPFFTTKNGKRFGMGLAFMEQSAKEAGGDFKLASLKGRGTTLTATFKHAHIDRRPLGDMTKTMITLIAANPEVNFRFSHKRNGDNILLDTQEIKGNLDGLPIDSPRILDFIKKSLAEFYSIPS